MVILPMINSSFLPNMSVKNAPIKLTMNCTSPIEMKVITAALLTCISWVFTVIVLSSFGSYDEAVKPWGTFLTFAFFSLISMFFAIFLPETKGKTLEEIERHFNHNRNQYIPLD